MSRIATCLLAVCLLAGSGFVLAQDSSDTPRDVGLVERVDVTLVTVDVFVTDGKGRSVPDLTKDDFWVMVGNKDQTVDTFDIACPIGAMDDPTNLGKDVKHDTLEMIGPDVKRKIVFLFDYYFMDLSVRQQVLDAASGMINMLKTDEEEIMLVALAYGARIEQRFTSDKRLLNAALQRMEHDATLWAREYSAGSSGREYFDDLITLMDVLDGYPESKAIVMFSAMTTMGTVNTTNWFNEVAMHAMASRAPIYPAFIPGLTVGGSSAVSQDLSRLANQSGGRMPYYTSDLSMSYRRAQRDLSCKYTLGIYVDNEEGRQRRPIHIRMKDKKYEARYPEMLKLFSDEEVQQNRARAAFIDPGPYENPLVRMRVWPAHPTATNSWDTLVTLNFPLTVENESVTFNLSAEVRKDSTRTRVEKYKNEFVVDPPADGSKQVSVTVFGDSKIKSGNYSMTAVLSKPGDRKVVSATSNFTIPEAPSDILIVRGPLLARVVPGGKLIRADKKERPGDTRLDKILGEGSSFEPLIVHQVKASEETLIYWNACVFGKSELRSAARVQRSILDDDGNIVHELDPMDLKLASIGKNLVCHDSLEKLPAGSLPPGEYHFDVAIKYANSGDLIGKASAPIEVLE